MKRKKELEKQNNKSKYLVICLVVLIVLLISYICVDKFLLNDAKKDNKKVGEKEEIDNNEDSDKTDIPEQIDKQEINGTFVIHQDERVYVADAKEFINSGKKEYVIHEADELADIEVYNNKIYYFDDKDNLRVYDITTKKDETYSFVGVEVNANTVILPGEDYTIVSDVDSFIKIDMKSKKYTNLNLSSNNYSMVLDSITNALYYVEGYTIVAYDIVNNKKIGTIGDGLPVYIDSNYIYINRDGNDAYYLDLYDKNTKEIISIKKEYGHHYEYISNYNGTVYMYNENRLARIDSNHNKEVFYDKYFLEVINTNCGIYIKKYEIEETDDEIIPSEAYSIYEYDYETKKIEEINNQYISDLFNSYTYYIEK